MSSNVPKVQYTHPMGPDGIVRCQHGEQVERCVSHTDKNPGREFYVCSRPKKERCSFWYWVDDPIFKKPSPQTPTPKVAAPASTPSSQGVLSSNGPCTPRPSPSTLASTLHSTPAKRKEPPCLTSEPRTSVIPTSNLVSPDTPSKKARIEAIEAGLQARRQDKLLRQPPCLQSVIPEQRDMPPFTHGEELNQVASAPSPSSETGTDVAEEIKPPRARYSFLGLPLTQESEPGAGPSTPKKRPSSAVDEKGDPYGHHGGTSSSALLTPPQSVQQYANRTVAYATTVDGSDSSRPDPVTPTRHKGKERAIPKWDQIEENPFVDMTLSFKARLEADALQRTPHSPRSSLDSQGLSCTPTTCELITAQICRMRDAVDALRTYAEQLDQLDALRYIERLERQKNSLVIGDEAKRKRIAELVAERDDLKEQVRRKDQIISRLTARQ